MQKLLIKKNEFLEYLAYLESLRSKNGLTFFIDQVKFYDKPDLRDKWVLKGVEATIITHRSGREKVIFYGAFCPQNQYIYTEEVIEETNEVTASFLITLRAQFPKRRLDVVLDNAPWHFGDDIRRIAKTYNIHLHYLPPYSPDLNPIEPLWKWARQKVTVNYDYNTFAEKKESLFDFFQKVSLEKEEIKRRLVMKFQK